MISRRTVLAGAAALTACAPHVQKPSDWLVLIAKAPAYDQSLYELLRRIIAEQKLDVQGKRVVLKPNLVEFDPGTTINTNPLLVHAAYEAFRAAGASEVRIAEGPGHRRVTLDVADEAGYFKTIPGFEGNFTDLNIDSVGKRRLIQPRSKLTELYLPETALGCDLLVSMPKMKTHHWVGATLSMKNLFGLVPGEVYGWPKNVLHWAGITECIVDLYRLFPNTFAIVDGIDGMEGNGPIQGTRKHAGVIVAGKNFAAVDATCCRIMGIAPERIGYLEMAVGAPALAETAIQQAGERIRDVRTPFSLLPQFQGIRLTQ